MAPPINVQDWYGDRHTCQIASGALDYIELTVTFYNCVFSTVHISSAEHTFRPLVLHFPVQIFWSRIFSPAFSVLLSFLVFHFLVLHFQSTHSKLRLTWGEFKMKVELFS